MKGCQQWQAETGDQALVTGHDVSPARACDPPQDQDASRVAPSEPQAKRPKRGNYVSKAWFVLKWQFCTIGNLANHNQRLLSETKDQGSVITWKLENHAELLTSHIFLI
jgi:hypothetical protein